MILIINIIMVFVFIERRSVMLYIRFKVNQLFPGEKDLFIKLICFCRDGRGWPPLSPLATNNPSTLTGGYDGYHRSYPYGHFTQDLS